MIELALLLLPALFGAITPRAVAGPPRIPSVVVRVASATSLSVLDLARAASGREAEPRPAVLHSAVLAPDSGRRRVVVLDAGHGGRDPGRVGPHGVKEKDVTLKLVRRLAGLLRARGYEVHLTRSKDTLISLADRPRLANQWKRGRPQAVFVSIHANGGAPEASGFETYFLSDARTEDERRVAEMENAAADYEAAPARSAPAVGRILESLRNDYYVRASDDLAELIQRHLARVDHDPNRGVKQAGFRVLVGAIMPAVLVETAFISNRHEERLLRSAAFQRKLTGALANALDAFFARHAWAAGAGH